jgi:hypothetical protein
MADEKDTGRRGSGGAQKPAEQKPGQNAPQPAEQTADQRRQDAEQVQGEGAQAVAASVEEAARQTDELRDTSRAVSAAAAEAVAEGQAAQGSAQVGADDEHPLVVGSDLTPLEGVPTFLERLAGSRAVYQAVIEGDEFATEDNPGAHLADGTIAHGTPVPTVAAAYREARARLGIPEPIRVDRSSGTTLLDTPGGQQMVPAGWTPDELARHATQRVLVQGQAASFPAGEEAGAVQRQVGGRPLGEKGQDHPEA